MTKREMNRAINKVTQAKAKLYELEGMSICDGEFAHINTKIAKALKELDSLWYSLESLAARN